MFQSAISERLGALRPKRAGLLTIAQHGRPGRDRSSIGAKPAPDLRTQNEAADALKLPSFAISIPRDVLRHLLQFWSGRRETK